MSESRTAKQLAAQKFDGITIAKPYGDLLGAIELSAIGFIWGRNFSGKSTLALGMANAMAKYGRVEYVPAEEQFGITLTKKINRLKATHTNLHFRHYDGLDELKTDISDSRTKVVFLDSVSVLSANDDEVIAFAQWCRDEGIGLWMVAHANKDGTYKGNSKYGHEADIRIEVMPEEDSSAAYTRKNRYTGEERSIEVPMTAKDIDYGSGTKSKKEKMKGKKHKKSKKGRAKSRNTDTLDAELDEIENLMQDV